MSKRRVGRVLSSVVMVAVIGAGLVSAAPPSGAGEVERLAFVPRADGSVSSSSPEKSYGTRTTLEVDGSPSRVTYLRFDIGAVAGREVHDVRLRLRQVGSTKVGGSVHLATDTGWTEQTLTWASRPTVDGPLVGSFGRVARGVDYEVSLGAAGGVDGVVHLAITSADTDGADWASRETSTPPQLLVDVTSTATSSSTTTTEATTSTTEATTSTTEATTSTTAASTTTSTSTTSSTTTTTTTLASTTTSAPATTTTLPSPSSSLTEVASATDGSSDPTYYSSNHRMAVTSGGRRLVVHGRHADGVTLTWRDTGSWSDVTGGDVTDGRLLRSTGTGDWPASIAVATTAAGEIAWVVYGHVSTSQAHPIRARRLVDLDRPDGPVVGPEVLIAGPGIGNARPDLALETAPDGSIRAAVTWARRADAGEEVVVAWILDGNSPVVTAPVVLAAGDSATKTATVEAGAGRVSVVARSGGGRLRVYAHARDAALDAWSAGAAGPGLAVAARPAAVVHGGRLWVAFESDTANAVSSVFRVNDDLSLSLATFKVTDLAQPTLADAGSSLVIIGVRRSDGVVVSRRWDGVLGSSVVELGAEGGGNHAWPNAVRDATGGALRFVVRGPRGSTSNSATAVLAVERPTAP